MKKQTIMYCHKIPEKKVLYWHIGLNPVYTYLHEEERDLIYQIKVIENPVQEGVGDTETYWGWWSNKDGRFHHVYYAKGLVEMCFPYDIKLYEERGSGVLLSVLIEELQSKVVPRPKDFKIIGRMFEAEIKAVQK